MVPKHHLLDEGINGGDGIEKQYWNLLRDRFPNYEMFWSEVIWDMTLRDKGSIHPHPGVKRELVVMSMCHYTLFRSLVYISVSKDATLSLSQPFEHVSENERMKNIYAHFGVVGDMANRIMDIADSLQAPKPIQQMTIDEATERFKEWFGEKYEKRFKLYQRDFRPVTFYLHARGDSIKRLNVKPETIKKFKELFEQRLPAYRNLIHSPDVGRVFVGEDCKVPRPEFLPEFSVWTDMYVGYPKNPEKFMSLTEALNRDFNDALVCLNSVWDDLIPKCVEMRRRLSSNEAEVDKSVLEKEMSGTMPTQSAAYLGSGIMDYRAASASGSIMPEAINEALRKLHEKG